MNRDLVLIGGGHTHALAIKSLAMNPIPEVRLTLVSEQTLTPYSGMLPGYIAGHYSLAETHIDLNRLCQWANVRWIKGRVSHIDPDSRQVLVDGRLVEYDKLSIDIGSTPDLSVPGAAQYAVGVKPVSHFNLAWEKLLTQASVGDSSINHGSDQIGGNQPDSSIAGVRDWGVIGAGAGGVELILAMAHRLGTQSSIRFHLIFSGKRILKGYPPRLIARAEKALQQHGVQLHPQFRVQRVLEDGLQSSDGQVLSLDQSISCTGAAAAPWLGETGIELSDTGFLAVNQFLQTLSHDNIFAVGDCADMLHDRRPKAGVYAVRQAPFLSKNLRASFTGTSLTSVKLQTDFLSLLSLGDRQAVGCRNGLVASGNWVWRLKDHIDRKFMNRLNNPASDSGMDMVMPPVDSDMHCAGCGSKLGPDIIASSLAKIPHFARNEVIPALGKAEDASVWTVPAEMVAVQSIDGFRSFSSDLYRFGFICANHALSDLYAMGAEPVSAQVWINLAFSHPRLQKRDHLMIMSGIAAALKEQQVSLAGGHSTEGVETHVAIVANGQARLHSLWKKTTPQLNDVIVLTKPIGTGVILAADMQARATASSVEAAFDSMLQSNQPVANLLVDYNPSAVTDVTGFGLLGHLLEMFSEVDLYAHIDVNSVPLLAGSVELARAELRSTIYPQLLPYTLQCDIDSKVDATLVDLLIDPQTSGGLLVALSSEAATQLCAQVESATIIGFVGEGAGPGRKRIKLN